MSDATVTIKLDEYLKLKEAFDKMPCVKIVRFNLGDNFPIIHFRNETETIEVVKNEVEKLVAEHIKRCESDGAKLIALIKSNTEYLKELDNFKRLFGNIYIKKQ